MEVSDLNVLYTTDGRGVLLDAGICGETLGRVVELITEYQRMHPEQEVYLDGDLGAFVSIPREASA